MLLYHNSSSNNHRSAVMKQSTTSAFSPAGADDQTPLDLSIMGCRKRTIHVLAQGQTSTNDCWAESLAKRPAAVAPPALSARFPLPTNQGGYPIPPAMAQQDPRIHPAAFPPAAAALTAPFLSPSSFRCMPTPAHLGWQMTSLSQLKNTHPFYGDTLIQEHHKREQLYSLSPEQLYLLSLSRQGQSLARPQQPTQYGELPRPVPTSSTVSSKVQYIPKDSKTQVAPNLGINSWDRERVKMTTSSKVCLPETSLNGLSDSTRLLEAPSKIYTMRALMQPLASVNSSSPSMGNAHWPEETVRKIFTCLHCRHKFNSMEQLTRHMKETKHYHWPSSNSTSANAKLPLTPCFRRFTGHASTSMTLTPPISHSMERHSLAADLRVDKASSTSKSSNPSLSMTPPITPMGPTENKRSAFTCVQPRQQPKLQTSSSHSSTKTNDEDEASQSTSKTNTDDEAYTQDDSSSSSPDTEHPTDFSSKSPLVNLSLMVNSVSKSRRHQPSTPLTNSTL